MHGRIDTPGSLNAVLRQVDAVEIRCCRAIAQEVLQGTSAATSHIKDLLFSQRIKAVPLERGEDLALQTLGVEQRRCIKQTITIRRNSPSITLSVFLLDAY